MIDQNLNPSPDNPVPTQQYESADAVHPNRQDFEQSRKSGFRKGMEWIINANNSIRIPSFMWIIIFAVFWLAALIVALWLPVSMAVVYEKGGFTFETQLTVDLINTAGFLICVVFPAYLVYYIVLVLSAVTIRLRGDNQ